MRNLLTILVVACGVFVSSSAAQQAPKSLPGEVIAIDTTNNQLKLKTNSGEANVSLDTKTEFKRLSPDKLSEPSSATPSSLSEISIGDKIVAVGILSDDKKTVTQTRRIFLLTKADIAKKQEADAARWTVRGIAGKVTVLNPATNTITIATRGGMQRTIIITANDKTVFHRYAPNSVKFSDAKVSNFTELKVGDQLRAVGEKSADNTGLTAEEILFGSFRTVAGKVTAIDAVKGEIIVKDLQTGKDVTISVNSETLLRRFPPEMAQRMAQMQVMRASGGMGGGQNPAGGVTGERTPNGAGQPTPHPNGQAGQMMPPNGVPPGAGGMGGGQGMRRGDVDSMLEQMPALALTELKIGDAVAASSSVGQTPERVTAIKFVAGIEPFLITPQPSGMPTGNRPQSSPSINIPGLDGIGAP